MERSQNGKFVCECGKDYLWPRSLRRHQRKCNIIKRKRDRETNDEDEEEHDADADDEGMESMDEMS